MGAPAVIANDDENEGLDGADGDAVHQRLIRQFDTITASEQDERQQALEDRRFVTIAGAQWEGDWGDQFENSLRVEIDKTSQGVERIMDQYRNNRLIVNFRAVDKGASEETAETLNGMFRADFYRSHGQQVFDNAFEEAVQGGYGAWRLTNKYVDERDPDRDEQNICLELITEADQCVFWVGGRLYDKSDATGCYVIASLTPDEFSDQYDGAAASWPENILKTNFDWFAPAVVRVAEYYEVEEHTELCRYYEHRATGETRREWAKDQDDAGAASLEVEGWELVRSRKVKRRRIHKYVLSGMEVLEDAGYIAGDQIPVVPVYGKRRIIDNIERVRGHVRKAKDPQRVYNSQISKLTETSALAPIERPIVTPEQIAGHQNDWARANIERHPYAQLNAILDKEGNPMPAGPIGKIEPPTLSPVLAALIQITASDIAELTNGDDSAAETKSNISAEAMDIAATRIDDKAFTYLDNMRQSVQRCGEVWLGMAREVYVEEGREVETIDGEGKTPGTATLAEPYTDPKSGVYAIRNDISEGRYKVISDVTEATTTRRDKTVRTLIQASQMAAAYSPETANAMLTTAILNMDGEGMTDLQDYLRKGAVESGLVKPTEAERREMADAAQQEQPPDPQGEALLAVAAEKRALAGKAVADTDLSKAKTAETIAKTHETRKNGLLSRFTSLFRPGGAKPK